MAYALLRHAFQTIFGNLVEALKASLGPIIIGCALAWIIAMALGAPSPFAPMEPISVSDPTLITDPSQVPDNLGGAIISALANIVILVVAFSLIAVTWHRFILLEEYPGVVPSMGGKPIGAYIGKSILLALLMLLIMVPTVMVVGLIASPFISMSLMLGGIVFALIAGVIFGYFWLRFAICLPAVSVNRQMGIRDSWSQSAPHSGTIVGVAVLLVLVNIVLGIPAQLAGANVVGLVLNLIATWITLMLGISILTTLYGVIVEGRDLPA